MGYFIYSLEELLPKKQGKSYLMHMNLLKKKNQENTMAIKCPKTAISNSLFVKKKKFKNNSPTTQLLISEVQFLTRLILQEALSQYIQGHDKRNYQVQSFEHKT